MNKYRIEIRLLSDLCVSDGGVYNSSIDVDICYDEQGFPYIPAKRLKGCLKECAQELSAWEIIEAEKIKKIFGNEGNQAGSMNLSNAYLKDCKELKEVVKSCKGNSLVHPQNVLNHYTYSRTQTAIDYDSGVAEDNSLRVMRVAKKGLVFEAELILDKSYKEDLQKCCTSLKHMGVARTRGLGEVQVKLLEGSSKDKDNSKNKIKEVTWKEQDDFLEYEITLEESIICKSVNGQDAHTMDYIDGSKILGIIAQRMKEDTKDNKNDKEDFLSFMAKGELKCSNAYICEDGHRFVEAPATLYSIKNNKTDYIDKIYETKESEGEYREQKLQLNSMKHCYVNYGTNGNGELMVKNVETEERYHHRRPNDKGIGHVKEQDDLSVFYQLSSIKKGQNFKGFITGSPEQIAKVSKYLSKCCAIRIGQGKGTEYGQAQLRITKIGKEDVSLQKEKEFFVLLQSPSVIYNEKATYSTDINDLRKEIAAALGIKEDKLQPIQNIGYNFVKYVTVGGFNITWGHRKPMVEAFDKGTVLRFSCKEAVEVDLSKTYWIGERCSEGYGEMKVFSIVKGRSNKSTLYKKHIDTDKETKIKITKSSFLQDIGLEIFKEFTESESAEYARDFVQNNNLKKNPYTKPTVSNMILMCKEVMVSIKNKEVLEENALGEIKRYIDERYGKNSEKKQKKSEVADEIVKYIESKEEAIIEDFMKKYSIEDFSSYLKDQKKDIKIDILYEFLIQMKYVLR